MAVWTPLTGATGCWIGKANFGKHHPHHPVIAAGVTGSIPAVARLLKTIAALPAGMVVLPGLDQNLDHASWEAVGRDDTIRNIVFSFLESHGSCPHMSHNGQ